MTNEPDAAGPAEADGPGQDGGSGNSAEAGGAGRADEGAGDGVGSGGAEAADGVGRPGGPGDPAGLGDAAVDADGAADDLGIEKHATPEQLLGAAKAARWQARRARHAYWFPLVLFGLLICASLPFYVQRIPSASGFHAARNSGGPWFLRSGYLGGFGPFISGHSAYYWLAAMLVGLAATAVWYRLRGDRIGLRTPSRGFVITGLVLVVLALLIPVLARSGGVGPLGVLMPGDLLIRGTFPLVLIGIGLCVLAWAERSIALTVIAAGYLALSLVASLYDLENVFYRLGWNINPAASGLPKVVLPALVLLLSGAGAWVVQRRRRVRPAGPSGAQTLPRLGTRRD